MKGIDQLLSNTFPKKGRSIPKERGDVAMKHRISIALGLLLLIAPAALVSQVNTATVSGTVTDTSGAVVPNANLTLENPATGVVRSAKSDVDGRFSFTFVPIGKYKLTTALANFQANTITGIELTADASLDLPIKMNVQNVESSVEVNASEEILQTTTSEQESTLPEIQLNVLPVARQNWVNLIALDASVAPQGANGIAINGLPPNGGYNVTVDGTNATSNPEYNSYNVYGAPNVINTVGNDAIAEVSVVKGVAPATVGGTLSGNINIITKTGTNQFHGGAYEINQLNDYNARNQFLTKNPHLTFNQFGGSIGGPIFRQKLFFFGNYEGAQARSLATVSGTVPTPYLASISPTVYQPLLAIYPSISQPASNPTALTTSYTGSASQIQKDGSGLIRLDGNINSNNQVAVRYIRARPQYLIPSIIPVNPQTYSGHTDAVNANYIHIGQSWTSNARFGFNQIKLTRINPGFNLGLNSLDFSGFGGSLNSALYKAFYQHGNYTTYEETIGLIRGHHSMQFGGILQRQNASRYLVQTPSVIYSTLSGWLANIPSNVMLALYSVPSGQKPFGFDNYQYGGYFQDDWKLTKTLTLNLGARYDYFTVPREYEGRAYNRGPDPAYPTLGAGFGPFRPANSIFLADYKHGVQPRIGFAWQVFPNTVVHGGFGILTIGHTYFDGTINLSEPSPGVPFYFAINQSQAQAVGINYPVTPSGYAAQISALQKAGVLSSSLPSITDVPAYNPNPYSLQQFFGVQQMFPGGIDIRLDYVGTEGVQLAEYEYKNLPNRVTGVAPDPTFGEFTQNMDGDHSRYNAMQMEAKRRTSKGLTLGVAYAWSHDLSYSDVDINQPSYPQDPDDYKAEFGPALFDVRQRVKVSGIWEIPFGRLSKSQSLLKRDLLDGWQISAIYSGNTGFPANVTYSNSSYPADRPDPVASVNLYVGGYKTFPGTHQYVSPSAFAAVPISSASGAQIRGGYLRRNAVRSPGLENWDASLLKNFFITEKVQLQLRGDAFNTLNHTNLSGLQTNFAASTFGRLTTATPRTLQIQGRITF
ncbi:TonB-dependent receptor plug [Candidatus Sulfotelmatomonas gaucii]|uniref:TonB-dependent receptor plug n=1 Tax=Candidatus Sulfuritelmatomonas gaucii TaxID=2043161 RepID=A0A2N9LC13_9BACT|nr:TonB-dependent receptor plug [Candidatus Sulfotelmatomonas gaucii]